MTEVIKFEGFEPTNEVRSLAKEVSWLIEDCSPSQSAQAGTISKTIDGRYKAFLKVSSTTGVFEAEVDCDNPGQAIDKLYEEIKQTLKQWSDSRVDQDAQI